MNIFGEKHLSDEKLLAMLDTSYRDFHTKGMDYVCLVRSDLVTIKLYFFDGRVSALPEVVHPHNHRYNFTSRVLAGEMSNVRYVEVRHSEPGEIFQAFDYLTPLNGGSGFQWIGERTLRKVYESVYSANEEYYFDYRSKHTIRIRKPRTVLMLIQGADQIAAGLPTQTFTKSKEPIDLSGLYRRFDEDSLLRRLRQVEKLVPGLLPELPRVTPPLHTISHDYSDYPL